MKITTGILLIITLITSSMIVNAGIKPGEIAPAFTLKSLNGENISLKNMTAKGHVMLVFWEPECVYCFMHIKDFNALHNKYKSKGFTLAAINFLGEYEEEIREYVSNNKLEYLMLTDQVKNIDVAQDYKVIGSPTIVVIAPDMKILYSGHKIPAVEQWLGP